MATKNLKKFLQSLTKDELVKHIVELDKKFKPVQEYYQLYLHNDIEAVLNKYKNKLRMSFILPGESPKCVCRLHVKPLQR